MINFGLNSVSILAQVNFGTNSASILGIFLAVSGAALYFLRTVRPELSRDQDIFFAAVGLLCGFILIFQGWRLDPILQFGQLLLVGTTVFFAVESIRLRSIATQQAKRNTPIVDEEREVSNKYTYDRRRRQGYQAEVDDDLDPLPYEEEERPVRPRIRASREERSSRDDYYTDSSPRRSERPSSSDKQDSGDRNRRRNSGRSVNRPANTLEQEDWGSASREVDDWDSSESEVRKPSRRPNNRPQRSEPRDEDVTPRPRRRRPASDSAPRRERNEDDAIPTDYVEYKPLERPDINSDDSNNFDDI